MRFKPIIMLSVLLMVPVKLFALEPVNEAHAMFYYHVPFGANKVEEKQHSFGFRMDHASYQHGEMIRYSQLMHKPAAFDFKMGKQGIKGMYVGGVDYFKLYKLRRAAEEDGSEAEADDSPNAAEEVASDVSDTIETIIDVVPLGFLIGGAVGVILISGAGG